MMQRARLIVLQALVAVLAVAAWHVLTSVPIFGTVLLPPFATAKSHFVSLLK